VGPERALESGVAAHRAVKLELQDVREEISRVRTIGRRLIFRLGVEVAFAALRGRRDVLMLNKLTVRA
jgi:hypothetical protein